MRRNLWFGSTTERRLAAAGASPVFVAVGLFLGSLCTQSVARGAVIRVAVASNFASTATALAEEFESSTGHRIVLVPGSTGKHFAQIFNGAPFDLLLAADKDRPSRLEEAGIGVSGSRFTYALGRLVLWGWQERQFESGEVLLKEGGFGKLAIAKPRLAPYGRAARQVLEALGLWYSYQERIVRGENVGQAFHFVASQNAELGLVSMSQVTIPGSGRRKGSLWIVPERYYKPIEQQALLLVDVPPSRALIDFVKSDRGKAIIQQFGYGVP